MQSQVTWTERMSQIVDLLRAKHLNLANSADDNDRRALIKIIGEQFRQEFGPRYGNKKRAGLGDEWRSKDSIGYLEDNSTVSVFDVFNGQTRMRQVNAGDHPHEGDSFLLAGEATFLPLQPVNHLGTTVPVPTPKPPAPTPTPAPAPSNYSLESYFAAGAMIRAIYLTELKRDILQDPAALVNWLFHWREGARDETWIRDRVRESDEWKNLQRSNNG